MPDREPRWLTPEQQRIWRDWLRVIAWTTDRFNSDLRAHQLDLNEYEVLVVLSEAPNHSMRMSQVAQGANQSRSRLTHTIGRMERAGLVVRETASEDRRGVVATLTDAGYEKLRQASIDHVESVRRALLDPIDPEDWRVLGRAMRAVLDTAGIPHQPIPVADAEVPTTNAVDDTR